MEAKLGTSRNIGPRFYHQEEFLERLHVTNACELFDPKTTH
jgi:hypothetical protein